MERAILGDTKQVPRGGTRGRGEPGQCLGSLPTGRPPPHTNLAPLKL